MPHVSALWHIPVAAVAAPPDVQATKRRVAGWTILATVVFNFVLCCVNTVLFGVTANLVIAVEVGLIGLAFVLTWDRSRTEYAILLLLAAYLAAVMALRANFNPQFARDILIPIVFFFLGRYLGTIGVANRLITIISVAALAIGLFEWFALDTYLRFFDVIHYYVARGSVT